MKSQKIFIFCTLLCIALLSACFSSWDGTDGNVPLLYTVTLTGSDGKPIKVGTTHTTPIVITVPPGTWDIEVRVDATEDDTFADTRQRFLGTKTINHDKEESVTLAVDINEMTPAIQVKTWGQLSKAFGEWGKYLKEAGWKSNGRPQYIELLEDTSATSTATLDGDSNQNIVLWVEEEGKRVTIKRGSNTGSLFQIKKGTLTLGGSGEGKIILDGDKASTTSNDSLIAVFGGKLIMNEGVTLQNNASNSPSFTYNNPGGGGGVHVYTGGEFTMIGGTISGNTTNGYGGGVYVDGGGKFFMEGGEISSNRSSPASTADTNVGGGGGVYVHTSGEFTLTKNGTISGNTTTGHGGGVRVHGEYNENKTVYREGTFFMHGGIISGNISEGSSAHSGGVRVRGRFTMTGGTISGNMAPSGGGVGIADDETNNGTFTMTGGAISSNEATSGDGGGIRVYSRGTFTKTGGIIHGNNDDNSLQNTATGSGQAVYAQSGNTTRTKNTTAGPGNNLSFSPNGVPGGAWD
jgi:hypothetical protein